VVLAIILWFIVFLVAGLSALALFGR